MSRLDPAQVAYQSTSFGNTPTSDSIKCCMLIEGQSPMYTGQDFGPKTRKAQARD